MNVNEEAILRRFVEKFPQMRKDKVVDLFEKYRSVCKKHLARSTEQEIANFPKAKAITECERFQYKKEKYWLWNEMGEGAPYFYTVEVGNNITRKLSRVKLSQRDIDTLIDLEDDIIVEQYYGDIDLNDCEPVTIDIQSLQNYIIKTRHDIDNKSYDNRFDTWKRNLRLAKKIKIIAKHFYSHYNDYVLPQIYSPSDYGRMYFKGLSLHSTSSALRGACIGDAMQYDLKAAAFAIRLIIAKDIYDEQNKEWEGAFTYTKEYLDRKEKIRKELGSLIHKYKDGVKLIKQTISAIGFGASTSNGSWKNEHGITRYSAISKIIMNHEDRKRVLEDEWMINFIKEQKQLTKVITDYYKDKSTFKDMSNTEIMCKLFMTIESDIMDAVCNHMDSDNIITRVHDGVYTKTPLLKKVKEEIRYTLESISSELVLEQEKIDAWYNVVLADEIEDEHKQHIKQEQSLAQNYTSQMISESINYQGDNFAHDSDTYSKDDRGNSHVYESNDNGSQHLYNSNLLETETFLNMNRQEKQDYKRIMNITKTNGDMPGSIYKLLNGDNI